MRLVVLLLFGELAQVLLRRDELARSEVLHVVRVKPKHVRPLGGPVGARVRVPR